MFENYLKCCIWILVSSTNFCPIISDMSGNTVWPQASGFQKFAKFAKFAKLIIFAIFANFCLKCKSFYWMRLFLWFSNTMSKYLFILYLFRWLRWSGDLDRDLDRDLDLDGDRVWLRDLFAFFLFRLDSYKKEIKLLYDKNY